MRKNCLCLLAVLFVFAGLLVGNFHPRIDIIIEEGNYSFDRVLHYGWPFPFLQAAFSSHVWDGQWNYLFQYYYPFLQQYMDPNYRLDWIIGAILDAFFALLLLVSTWVVVRKYLETEQFPFQFSLRIMLSGVLFSAIFLGMLKENELTWSSLCYIPIAFGSLSACVMFAGWVQAYCTRSDEQLSATRKRYQPTVDFDVD